jgi:hypothetical protein
MFLPQHVDCARPKNNEAFDRERETQHEINYFLSFRLNMRLFFRGLSQFIDETFEAQLEISFSLQPSLIHQSTSLDGIRNIKIYIVVSSLHVLFSLMRRAWLKCVIKFSKGKKRHTTVKKRTQQSRFGDRWNTSDLKTAGGFKNQIIHRKWHRHTNE